MSLREKREARRARENEILKQMAEANAVEEEVHEAEAAAQEAAADSAAAAAEGAEKPADEAAGPSYTPMTDEQIRKVKMILWPILFVIAIVVYFVMKSCKG